MNTKKLITRTLFLLFLVTMLIAILVPFFAFLATSLYSSSEVYQYPRTMMPRFTYDMKITWEDDMYQLSVYEDDIEDYELKIYTNSPEKLRIYLKKQYSVQLTDEEIVADFSKSKDGTAVYMQYKKDLLYNFKTFFTITSNADKAIMNSIIAAGWTILISLSIGSMAGYTIARYRIKWKKQINLSLLIVRMFPMVAVSIPMLVYLIRMGLNGTMFGLAIVYSVGNIALTAWITNSIFQGISVELEEASLVFGANKIQTFFKITLPLAFPGLVACSMYAFLAAWNDSIVALILSNSNPTLSLLIYKAIGMSGDIQLAAAGAVILVTPSLIFTFIIKNYINQLWGDVKF
ncbi:MAG: carbohydrate ABC transporter permease [Clostridiales bacterium]|nr:carbohydrate ABC transporter permease [Clostridiales bacterium]